MVEKVSGKKINWDFGPRRPGDPAVLIASSELVQKELRWQPKYADLESIVKSAWEWHSNGNVECLPCKEPATVQG